MRAYSEWNQPALINNKPVFEEIVREIEASIQLDDREKRIRRNYVIVCWLLGINLPLRAKRLIPTNYNLKYYQLIADGRVRRAVGKLFALAGYDFSFDANLLFRAMDVLESFPFEFHTDITTEQIAWANKYSQYINRFVKL